MIRFAVPLLALLLGLAALPVQAAETYRLAHMFPRASLPDRCAERFAELVAQRSQQAVRIDIHGEGRLGDERENVAQLRRGMLDFAITGDVVVSNVADHYRVVNMPFVYRDATHALEVYASDVGQAIRGAIRTEGVEVLSWHFIGTRWLTANRPVRNLADLKGLALRLPQDSAWTTTWQALGTQPRQVPFPELASALRHGRVEAQENPPNFIRASRLHEHQRYLVRTEHMPQRQMILASDAFWKRVPAARRQLLQDAASEASRWATATAAAEEKTDIAWLTGEGKMTLLTFDRAGVEAAIADVPRLLGGDEGIALLDRIRKLR